MLRGQYGPATSASSGYGMAQAGTAGDRRARGAYDAAPAHLHPWIWTQFACPPHPGQPQRKKPMHIPCAYRADEPWRRGAAADPGRRKTHCRSPQRGVLEADAKLPSALSLSDVARGAAAVAGAAISRPPPSSANPLGRPERAVLMGQGTATISIAGRAGQALAAEIMLEAAANGDYVQAIGDVLAPRPGKIPLFRRPDADARPTEKRNWRPKRRRSIPVRIKPPAPHPADTRPSRWRIQKPAGAALRTHCVTPVITVPTQKVGGAAGPCAMRACAISPPPTDRGRGGLGPMRINRHCRQHDRHDRGLGALTRMGVRRLHGRRPSTHFHDRFQE